MKDDDEANRNGEAFEQPFNMVRADRVSGNALQTLTVNRSNTTKLLPLCQDVHSK